jgi:hypothetical protein
MMPTLRSLCNWLRADFIVNDTTNELKIAQYCYNKTQCATGKLITNEKGLMCIFLIRIHLYIFSHCLEFLCSLALASTYIQGQQCLRRQSGPLYRSGNEK